MNNYGNQPFPQMRGGGFVEHAGHHGGPSNLAWVIFSLLLLLLLISLVSLALDAYYRSQGQRPLMKWLPGAAAGDRALAVLDVRYARGEISRKDYLQAREDLGAPGDADAEATTEVQAPAPRQRGRKTES